jgi:hypothetical protein
MFTKRILYAGSFSVANKKLIRGLWQDKKSGVPLLNSFFVVYFRKICNFSLPVTESVAHHFYPVTLDTPYTGIYVSTGG